MKRDKSVDIAKGIGIILVVLAHVLTGTSINKFIYMFHMPLFFFLAGISYFYSKDKNGTFKEFTLKKFKTIMVPYFIFSILSFIYWCVIERKIRGQMDISVLSNFINIFACFIKNELYSPNVVMWFLPCLFTSNIIFYLVMKMPKMKGITVFVLSIIGFILCRFSIILPLGIETSLVSLLFIYIGYKYKERNFNITKGRILIGIIISVLGLIISYLLNSNVNMLSQTYGNAFLFIIGALSGIIFIIITSNILNKICAINSCISFLGINSLVIMMTHEPIKRIVLKIYSVLIKCDINLIRENILHCCINTTIIIAIIIPIILIINEFLPWMIGKNKKVHLKPLKHS